MPRIARVVAEGVPHHVTQRGNARQRVFHCAEDYELYKDLLWRYAAHSGLALWAYCLMPNHVHLICVPAENPRKTRDRENPGENPGRGKPGKTRDSIRKS
jgi:REP element-mobilizing transposase RayT